MHREPHFPGLCWWSAVGESRQGSTDPAARGVRFRWFQDPSDSSIGGKVRKSKRRTNFSGVGIVLPGRGQERVCDLSWGDLCLFVTRVCIAGTAPIDKKENRQHDRAILAPAMPPVFVFYPIGLFRSAAWCLVRAPIWCTVLACRRTCS